MDPLVFYLDENPPIGINSAAYPNRSEVKRVRRTIFEVPVYLKLVSSKAKRVRGCCESTIVVDALESSSSLRKRNSDRRMPLSSRLRKRTGDCRSLTEVLEAFQTTPCQLRKVRAIDVEPFSEAQFAKDIVMVDQIRGIAGLIPIGTKEF